MELHQRRPDVTAVQARFVPALSLDAEPAWVERLIALAKPPGRAHSRIAAPTPSPATNYAASVADTLMSGLPFSANQGWLARWDDHLSLYRH